MIWWIIGIIVVLIVIAVIVGVVIYMGRRTPIVPATGTAAVPRVPPGQGLGTLPIRAPGFNGAVGVPTQDPVITDPGITPGVPPGISPGVPTPAPIIPTVSQVRYIRLLKPSARTITVNGTNVNTTSIINLMGVEVGTGPNFTNNIALGAPVQATSQLQGYPPSNLTDGNRTTLFHTASNAPSPQSVTIDLRTPTSLPLQVRVINRITSPDVCFDCPYRAIGIHVQLLNSNREIIDERTIEDMQTIYTFNFN